MDDNRKLYGELGELTRYIENTMRQLRTAEAPVTETTIQLPQASEHLSGLAKLTEEGTHRVMELTEELQDNRRQVSKLLGELFPHLASGREEPLVRSHRGHRKVAGGGRHAAYGHHDGAIVPGFGRPANQKNHHHSG